MTDSSDPNPVAMFRAGRISGMDPFPIVGLLTEAFKSFTKNPVFVTLLSPTFQYRGWIRQPSSSLYRFNGGQKEVAGFGSPTCSRATPVAPIVVASMGEHDAITWIDQFASNIHQFTCTTSTFRLVTTYATQAEDT